MPIVDSIIELLPIERFNGLPWLIPVANIGLNRVGEMKSGGPPDEMDEYNCVHRVPVVIETGDPSNIFCCFLIEEASLSKRLSRSASIWDLILFGDVGVLRPDPESLTSEHDGEQSSLKIRNRFQEKNNKEEAMN